MKIPNVSTCDFLGWALLDLDDPIPRQALMVANYKGIQVEEFIEEAIAEKLERMDEIPDLHLYSPRNSR